MSVDTLMRAGVDAQASDCSMLIHLLRGGIRSANMRGPLPTMNCISQGCMVCQGIDDCDSLSLTRELQGSGFRAGVRHVSVAGLLALITRL